MHWKEVWYEILDYKSKLIQIKLFHVFRGLHQFNNSVNISNITDIWLEEI